jgi:hypothetical protein
MRLAIVSRRSLFACSSIDETRNGKLVIAVEKRGSPSRCLRPLLDNAAEQEVQDGPPGRAALIARGVSREAN